ncbi:MAG: hypothetical protein AABX29_06210 [Nanoarchaeota archaeon]
MFEGYGYEIIVGIIFGILILLLSFAFILEELFPKNRISKWLEKLVEWIKDNVRP